MSIQQQYIPYLIGIRSFGHQPSTLIHFLMRDELLRARQMLWIEGRPVPKCVGLSMLRKIPMYELDY